MSNQVEGAGEAMILHPDQIELVDRGTGVRTTPLVGKWNASANHLTSGMTVFEPGTGIAVHSHNVEETVMVLEGEAMAVIEGVDHELQAGDVTWIPAGVPHFFRNRGRGQMRIYWVYASRDVTRTLTETGVTIEHLSEADRQVARRSG